MITTHTLLFQNASNLEHISSGSVALAVTSPPYPMIEMWDAGFTSQNPDIARALEAADEKTAFELMHLELDKVWSELYRVLIDGGIACINIGDATRTVAGRFQLFSNHARIIQHCIASGFMMLPIILWRKPTNSPNKFMGSGMLAPGAYVTLEHEYILIFRKGGKREFSSPQEKERRAESAFFWEERNRWFSDIWELKGTPQKMTADTARQRSAAFPFELAYRLINMFSVQGDTVVDPFLGTGTSMKAAIAAARNSIGVEIDPDFGSIITNDIKDCGDHLNQYIQERLQRHREFAAEYQVEKKALKYTSVYHDFPVMTRQEIHIRIPIINEITQLENGNFQAGYSVPNRP